MAFTIKRSRKSLSEKKSAEMLDCIEDGWINSFMGLARPDIHIRNGW